MPEMDGFALLQTIRDEKLAVGAKLVALTNQSDEAEQNKAKELGADRYIIKASMIPSEVVAAITEEISKS
jgi:DNA-binding response OmpR family regulator